MVTRHGRGKRQEIEQTWALGVLGEPVFDRVLLPLAAVRLALLGSELSDLRMAGSRL